MLDGLKIDSNKLCAVQVQHGARCDIKKAEMNSNLQGCVVMGHGSELTIEKSQIKASHVQGIAVTAGGKATIESTLIQGSNEGVALTTGAVANILQGSHLLDNKVGIVCDGSREQQTGRPEPEQFQREYCRVQSHFTVEGSTIEGGDIGVVNGPSCRSSVKGTQMVGMRIGVYVRGCRFEFIGGSIEGCTEYGIDVREQSVVDVNHVDMHDQSIKTLFKGNDIAIFVHQEDSFCNVYQAEFIENIQAGVYVTDYKASFSCLMCLFQDNVSPGAILRHKGKGKIEQCRFARNGGGLNERGGYNHIYWYQVEDTILLQGKGNQEMISGKWARLREESVNELKQHQMDAILDKIKYDSEQEVINRAEEAVVVANHEKMVRDKEEAREAKEVRWQAHLKEKVDHADKKKADRKLVLDKMAAQARN